MANRKRKLDKRIFGPIVFDIPKIRLCIKLKQGNLASYMRVLMIILALMLVPVEAYSQAPSIPDEHVKLTVFRPRDFQSIGFTLKINGQTVVSNFKNKSYVELKLKPGLILLETSGSIVVEKKQFSLDLKAGEIYFLEAVIDYGFLSSTFFLIKRDETHAREVIKNLQKLKD